MRFGTRRESPRLPNSVVALPLPGERAEVRAVQVFCCSCFIILLAAALPAGAAVFQENFATDPFVRGWRAFGDPSLFHWNAANQNLEVTWDSSRTNSYFHLPLGTVITKSDDFSFSFDVRLSDIQLGNTPGKTNEFQIAVGLIDYTSAIRTNHFAGAGVSTAYGIRNALEFDYFPDAGFGETFSTVVVSTNNRIYPAHNFPLRMTAGDTFRIGMTYTASNQLLRTSATRNGVPFGMPPANTLGDLSLAGRNDFRVDTFAVISYSDAIQAGPPMFHGSVLAHGIVDNIQITVPPPPVSGLRLVSAGGHWQARFVSATNWNYTLERSDDLAVWSPASPATAGTGAMLGLQETNPTATKSFFRVCAERP